MDNMNTKLLSLMLTVDDDEGDDDGDGYDDLNTEFCKKKLVLKCEIYTIMHVWNGLKYNMDILKSQSLLFLDQTVMCEITFGSFTVGFHLLFSHVFPISRPNGLGVLHGVLLILHLTPASVHRKFVTEFKYT
jgi:hypothetical protein